jgi:hypothetical protein
MLGLSWIASNGRDSFHQLQELRDVVSVRSRELNGQRSALRIREEVVLAPRFPSVDGAWTRLVSSTHRTDERAIDDSQAQVELACCAQLRKELLKEPLPYAMLMPPHETPEARGARGPDLGRGQCVPWNTCLQDEDYPFECLPVPNRLSSCILAMPIRPFGQEWFHTLPEFIRDQWPTHGRSMRTPDAIDQLHGLILQQALKPTAAW